MRVIPSLFFLLLGFAASPSPQATAGIGLDVEQFVMYDANAFRNSEQIPDLVFQPEVRLAYSTSSESNELRFAYDGTLTFFQEYRDRRFQHHEISAKWSHAFREQGPDLSVLLTADTRINQNTYSEYDYRGGSGLVTLRFGQGGGAHWLIKGSAQVQQYSLLREFSYEEYQLAGRMTRSFESRTTVIAQVQAGTKHYLEPMLNRTVVQIPIPNTRQGKKYANWRKKHGDQTPWTVERVIQTQTAGKRMVQGALSLRIAQALFHRSGVAVQGLIRRNTGAGGRYMTFQESGYEQDDPLFDDPYNYNSDEASLEFTQKLPWNVQCKAGWEGLRKQYQHPVYDTTGAAVPGTRRKDGRNMFWISFDKGFSMHALGAEAGLSVTFSSLRNRSNDGYFDYRGGMAGAGFTMSF